MSTTSLESPPSPGTGSWAIHQDRDGTAVLDPRGELIALVRAGDRLTQRSIAALIVAAPAMLSACLCAHSWLTRLTEEQPPLFGQRELLNQLADALALARSEEVSA